MLVGFSFTAASGLAIDVACEVAIVGFGLQTLEIAEFENGRQ